MLTEPQLKEYCHRLGFSDEACRVINNVRSSPPQRRVQGRRGNVCIQYKSPKMRRTIQGESHKVEGAGIYEKEFSNDTFEYWDQPPSCKLEYESKEGKKVAPFCTFDFFVLEVNGAGWEEWKTEDELIKLAEKMPNRYIKDGDTWRCPPGEKYAAKFGFFFRVRSSAEINWYLQRNLTFLEDYLQSPNLVLDQKIVKSVIEIISKDQGITLDELLARTHMESDTVYTLIARGEIYVNLQSVTLAEAEGVEVFSDIDAAKGYAEAMAAASRHDQPYINIAVGSTVDWDGQPWVVTNLGDTHTTLMLQDGTCVPILNTVFDNYVKTGIISNPDHPETAYTHPEVLELLSRASPSDFEIANKRLAIVKGWDSADKVPSSSARRHKQHYRQADERYGCGYVGLLPRHYASGNRLPKLPKETQETMEGHIRDSYETIKQKHMNLVYGELEKKCEELGMVRLHLNVVRQPIAERVSA